MSRDQPPPRRSAQQEARLAAQLRANLKRRKAGDQRTAGGEQEVVTASTADLTATIPDDR